MPTEFIVIPAETSPPYKSTLADHEGIGHLVAVFVTRMTGYVQELRAYSKAGDMAGLERLSHQLKGAGNSYGFGPITTLAQQVEDTLRANRPAEEVRPLVDALIGYMRQVDGYRE